MSNLKIGVLADCFGFSTLSLREKLEKSASVGAQGVQLYATSGELAPENMNAAKIAEVRDMVASNGLVISAVCGDLGGGGFRNAEDNKWKVEKSKRIMDLALELGANVITTHIGVVPEEMNDARKNMSEACNELAEYGDKMGAYFAIETGPEPAERLRGFIESLSAKAVRVNFDPANLAMVIGEKTCDSVASLRDYIVHTHAKDGIMINKTNPEIIYGHLKHEEVEAIEYFREVPLGEGSVDFDGYLKFLNDTGWNGFLTIERECGNNPEEDIKKAVSFLNEKIKNL